MTKATLLHNTPFLSLVELSGTRKGKTFKWVMATRKKFTTNYTFINSPDAVVIAGVNEDNKLLVIKEWRHSLQGYEISIPAGLVEDGTSVQDTAVKELHEETGMKCTSVIKTGNPVAKTSGLTDETSVTVYMNINGTISSDYLEASEDIEAMLLNQAEVMEPIHNPSNIMGSSSEPVLNLYAYTGKIHPCQL